jgi:hypothetical protein
MCHLSGHHNFSVESPRGSFDDWMMTLVLGTPGIGNPSFKLLVAGVGGTKKDYRIPSLSRVHQRVATQRGSNVEADPAAVYVVSCP